MYMIIRFLPQIILNSFNHVAAFNNLFLSSNKFHLKFNMQKKSNNVMSFIQLQLHEGRHVEQILRILFIEKCHHDFPYTCNYYLM